MKFEPETLVIGIIDLFSIMLPGALATALPERAVEPLLPSTLHCEQTLIMSNFF